MSRDTLRRLVACGVVFAAAPCGATAQATTPATAQAPAPSAKRASQAAAGDEARESAAGSLVRGGAPLQPGDKLRVNVWREPEYTGEFVVTEHGTVILPKLGAVTVVGRDPEAVVDEVTTGYARSVIHSSITVVPMRRVQVIGAVRTPGLYHADPTMSVGDVLALAGGASSQGRTDRITLVRGGRRVAANVPVATLVRDATLESGDQIVVPERNFFSQNPGVVATIISAAVGLSIALFRR